MGVETEGLSHWDESEGGWVEQPAEPMVVEQPAPEEPEQDDNAYNRPHPAEHNKPLTVTMNVDDLAAAEAGMVSKFTQSGGTVPTPTSAPAASVSAPGKGSDRARTQDGR